MAEEDDDTDKKMKSVKENNNEEIVHLTTKTNTAEHKSTCIALFMLFQFVLASYTT